MFSAGSKPGTLNPYAVTALAEMGIDISTHRSKGFDAVPIDRADYVITLCAEEECPYIVSPARRLSWAMPDPAAANGREAKIAAFRDARDDIARRLQAFWETELASRDRQ